MSKEQLDKLEAAWLRLKTSLEKEPATKEVHAVYESMRKAIDSFKPEAGRSPDGRGE